MSDETMRNDETRDDAMNGPGSGSGMGASLPVACAAFDAALADYMEHDLDAGARAEAEAHRASCARCNALAADLEAITRGARALAPIVPSTARSAAIWTGISARIEAPAVPIEVAASARRERLQREAATHTLPARFAGWRRQALAAAALVLVTAGVTYSVTRQVVGGRGPEQVVQAPGAALPPRVDSLTTVAAEAAGAGGATGPSTDPLITSGGSAALVAANPRGATRRGGSVTASVSVRRSAERVYEREISGLRRILDERRGELDSTTVAVLERNLAVIDQAIAQSRAALRKDPRSRFLDQQLTSALDKKIELLRTAALLPART